MVHPVLLRFYHINQQPGQVFCIGRRSNLVIDHPQGVVGLPHFQHGLYKVITVQPEHPGDPDNKVLLQQVFDRQFPFQFASAVHIQGRKGLAFRFPGFRSLAVKYIVRADVQHFGIQDFADLSDISGSLYVHRLHLGLVFLIFCSIHRRPGSTVDHPIGTNFFQHRPYFCFVGNIHLHIRSRGRSTAISHSMVSCRRPAANPLMPPCSQFIDYIMAQLAIDTRYQDFHVVTPPW